MAKKVENLYERAAAIWVARYYGLDADLVSDVDFCNYRNGGCETCGYETLGLEFEYKGKHEERQLGYYGVTPGQFVQECVEILKELESQS